MAEPVIADTKPVVMELEAGDYFWCTCGQSSNQPFCNGAHAGTEFTPMKFALEGKSRWRCVPVNTQAMRRSATAPTLSSRKRP